ncbi:leucine-rich repeat domain-containing protein [Lignipirellula cremea]|uniref:Leucine Rich repeats (2 copies) n=1 Tax=Lignipirellula cremea TaxID=2528010 RepID=A0A518E4K9_9BACT|nr:hypothetical protein [Lignipirellula cremea]QDU99008.1 Leucine Rich repeats (2 copies) [Lignipirellula cremea]
MFFVLLNRFRLSITACVTCLAAGLVFPEATIAEQPKAADSAAWEEITERELEAQKRLKEFGLSLTRTYKADGSYLSSRGRDYFSDEKQSISPTALQSIKGLPGLVEVGFSWCILDDEAAAILINLPDLKAFVLDRCELTEKSIASLVHAKKLRVLYLEGTDLSDESLQHLGKLTDLEVLDIRFNEQLTDEGIAHLSKLQQLKRLNIYHNQKITDASLKVISGLENLERLNVRSIIMTSVGLRHLGSLKKLKLLELDHSNQISPAAIEAFQKAVPECQLVY